MNDRWREASGIHHACSCCDTDCRAGTKSSLTVKGKQQHTLTHIKFTRINMFLSSNMKIDTNIKVDVTLFLLKVQSGNRKWLLDQSQ